MDEQIRELNVLIGSLPPSSNLPKGYSQLNNVLSRYTAILDYFNSYNDDLRIATSVYYSDITDIRDNIQISLYSRDNGEKDAAFHVAKRKLETDIQSLVTLVKK